MSKSLPAKVFNIAGVPQFFDHLEALIAALSAIQELRGSKRQLPSSAHGKILDKKRHIDAQAAADLLSVDLSALLHPGLNLSDWTLTVKSGGRALRWARAGSGGRGGVDLNASFAPALGKLLASWVAASLVIHGCTPDEVRDLEALGLPAGEPMAFEMYTNSQSLVITAPSPTLAFLHGDILKKLPDFVSLSYVLSRDHNEPLKAKFQSAYKAAQGLLATFPDQNGCIHWSAYPEIKQRLEAHPILQKTCSSDLLRLTSGQIDREMRDTLASYALDMANQALIAGELDAPLQRWVVAAGDHPGLAVRAPGPSAALMATALHYSRHGPRPDDHEEWQAYLVQATPTSR